MPMYIVEGRNVSNRRVQQRDEEEEARPYFTAADIYTHLYLMLFQTIDQIYGW